MTPTRWIPTPRRRSSPGSWWSYKWNKRRLLLSTVYILSRRLLSEQLRRFLVFGGAERLDNFPEARSPPRFFRSPHGANNFTIRGRKTESIVFFKILQTVIKRYFQDGLHLIFLLRAARIDIPLLFFYANNSSCSSNKKRAAIAARQ